VGHIRDAVLGHFVWDWQHLLPAPDHFAFRERDQPEERLEYRRLPRTIGTHD
jgi:hypothetical protein